MDGRIYDIYHFDLPPVETGIFSAALLAATAPPVEEPQAERVERVELPEVVEEKPLPKERLDAAKSVAAGLNQLKNKQITVETEIPPKEAAREGGVISPAQREL